ncbi:hypothetical protein [Novosphingobium sp. Rr 2-17]|uniref:hypothetical protein n=1 Tax=Novosphingobium sp. Rr 2-17 TaxID=555793 RepID=UPI00031D00B8|nr:hypothetical protein [Novosphingobium sp. Rr 2-17]
MLRQVETGCNAAIPATTFQTVDPRRRNRHETRTTTVFDAADTICAPEWRDAVTTIIRVERVV